MVVQTSANATDGARDTQWNDALVLQDAAVYAAYLAYSATWRPAPHARTTTARQAGKYRLDFFPVVEGRPDQPGARPGLLRRRHPDPAHASGTSPGGRSRGGCGSWTTRAAGCRWSSTSSATVVHALTKKGGGNGNPETRYLTEGGRTTYAHSKYLLIDGQYRGKPQKVVFTGSNNYTTVGFHGHDEAMITVADRQLEAEYATNFDAVFEHGHAVKPTDPDRCPSPCWSRRTPRRPTTAGELG